jgi:hypothetical protein
MDTFFINGQPVESIVIPKEELSEIRIKKLLKDNYRLGLMTKEYSVGEAKFVLGLLTIDNSCPVSVYSDRIEAGVLYDYYEYSSLEEQPNTKVVTRNGRKVIEATAIAYYENIFRVYAVPGGVV